MSKSVWCSRDVSSPVHGYLICLSHHHFAGDFPNHVIRVNHKKHQNHPILRESVKSHWKGWVKTSSTSSVRASRPRHLGLRPWGRWLWPWEREETQHASKLAQSGVGRSKGRGNWPQKHGKNMAISMWKLTWENDDHLVGGLEHLDYFSIYWE